MYTQTHRDTGIKSEYVTDRFAIQFKAVRRLIMSEDFWDTLKVATLVLKPALVALRYCDGMKGGTVALLYDHLLELDFSCSHSLICFCNGQTILSEGDGSRGQDGYLVSDGGFL